MEEVGTIYWTGKSGCKYKYEIYAVGQLFTPVPGNFIFAREISPHQWLPVYIGETVRMNELFEMSDWWRCILRYNATHIHVHESVTDLRKRCAEVSDLLAKYKAPCNV
jgi:hypothetical protein